MNVPRVSSIVLLLIMSLLCHIYAMSIHNLVMEKNGPALKNYLKQNAHLINTIDEQGQTPLHKAAMIDSISCFEILLEFFAENNIQDKKGQTPLYLAAKARNESFVLRLLEHGASPYLITKKNKTFLHKLAKRSCYFTGCAALETILDAEERIKIINQKDKNGRTALYTAIRAGNEGMVQALLQYGASSMALDSNHHIFIKDGFMRASIETDINERAQHHYV